MPVIHEVVAMPDIQQATAHRLLSALKGLLHKTQIMVPCREEKNPLDEARDAVEMATQDLRALTPIMTIEQARWLLDGLGEAWRSNYCSFDVDIIIVDGQYTAAELRRIADIWDASHDEEGNER